MTSDLNITNMVPVLATTGDGRAMPQYNANWIPADDDPSYIYKINKGMLELSLAKSNPNKTESCINRTTVKPV
jgi:hypothetical protein